jgi:hypothetical protein
MKLQFYLIFSSILVLAFSIILFLTLNRPQVKYYLVEKEVAENFYRENILLFSNFGKEYAINFSKEFFKIYSLRENFKFLNIYIQASNVLNITILNFLKNSTIRICSDLECYQNFIEFGKSYDFSLNYSSNFLEIYFENIYKKINISKFTLLSIFGSETIYSIKSMDITNVTIAKLACLSAFNYRIPITINNTQNSNNLIDYQILVILDTQSLISQGKMRSDCGDIRFTDENNNLLNYWIESGCNSQNTRIWVKVPNIPASSTKTIYLYYGNPNATSLSNGDTTFDFFDDFSADPNTNGKWEIYRYANDLNNEFVYDSINKRVYLTKAITSRATMAFLKNINAPNSFRLITYGGAGGGSGADGWAIAFYKDINPYRSKGRACVEEV